MTDIKEILKGLDSDSLEEAYTYVLYLKSKDKKKGTISEAGILFFDSLRRHGINSGISNFPFLDTLEYGNEKAYKLYTRNYKKLDIWIKNTFQETPSKLLDLLAKIHIKGLKDQFDNQLSYTMIMTNLERLPLFFEREFPEYIGNNLAKVIISKCK